ncbi:hypothetical protein [Pontibacter sp. SGAir0037]|uniref:hypothetical protein n=1 Tax=Pontibacter sp. SGAir0037 TaxID=2571030 RepID=UPI0010CD0B58|nr:hypothetical protein [Pontibacter sp. SGAir0037]QCR20952.1 hypothetical protein C1N53_00280 [Pontibacter sp. SGAir0037]
MLLLRLILPFLLSLFLLRADSTFTLLEDIAKDQQLLTNDFVYVDDNTSINSTVASVLEDLQLFQVAGSIGVEGAKHTSNTQGNHTIHKWAFPEGDIKAIYQIESQVALDTVVTQQYLDGKAPKQQRIMNNFRFRAYAVATSSAPLKMYYLTEEEQGLLAYRIDQKEVNIGYSKKKNGLTDLLPVYTAQVERLLGSMQ